MKNKKFDVAMFHASIRPEHWIELYKSIKNYNKTTFKIFFCGPKKPSFDLPEEKVALITSMLTRFRDELTFGNNFN